MIEITHKPLKVMPVMEKLTHPECGAVVTFLGVARNHHGGKKVTHLSYEAYPEMALKKLKAIREALMEKYEIQDLAILHRLGPVGIQEASLVVVVAAPHRAPALKAVEEVVDLIKTDVPIWKKEFYEDGSKWIEPGV